MLFDNIWVKKLGSFDFRNICEHKNIFGNILKMYLVTFDFDLYS